MRRIIFIIGFIFIWVAAFATHNRAGEITFRHISGFKYEITILTYTYSPSPADRPTLEVFWGDGTSSIVNRYKKQFIGNLTNMNLYRGEHTYNGNGNFVISVEDPNRNGGVTNIPNSINVPFYIETELVINPYLGVNNSVKLLNPPIDNGCVGFPFLHNPAAYDPDGDSISYALAVCKGAGGNNIPGFSFPAASNSFSIDPVTGTLTWDSPLTQGEYNVAIMIYEWRFGVLIGSVRRDMQITIAACNNNPPVLQHILDTCVEAGKSFSTTISATDVDNDMIKLTGTGGPLVQANNPAQFNQPVYGTGSVSSVFSWSPLCEHVKKQPYQMVFKAQDNGSPVNLVDINTLRIKVVGPAVKNATATAQGNSITIKWNKYGCANAVRYDIYRHNGYIGYHPDPCVTGVPAWTGYVKIASTNAITDTTFVDNNNGYGLIHGNDYCYMIVALFPDSAESYPSLETCASLSKDVPVITHVTVDTTAKTKGKITLKWSKPSDLDTSKVPGPYKYLIYHSQGKGNYNMVLIDSLNGMNDTVYQVVNLNTMELEHNFRVDFLTDAPGNRYIIGGTQIASSVFIKTVPKDRKMRIEWDEFVPWKNYDYVIYRQNQSGGFDSIGHTPNRFYVDSNLINGQTYCYKIKSTGEYSSNNFTKPLYNFSQYTCDKPVDNEPPCPPQLIVEGDCKTVENTVIWNDVKKTCGSDFARYTLYYSPTLNGDFVKIYTTTNAEDTVFLHTGLSSIAGCYTITATDSNGNISDFSVKVCMDIDSCRPYRLPNIFTPNGDGFNDKFHPYPYDFVDKINLVIYNRWGVPVFTSEDPDINWDGRDMNTNKECSEGVYFYVCEVFEQRLEGIVKRDIKGTVTLIRNQ